MAASAMGAGLSALSHPTGAVSYLHMTPSAGGTAVRIPLLTHPRPALDLDPQQHYLFKRDDTAKGADQDGDKEAEAATSAAPKVKRSADQPKNATDEDAAADKAAAAAAEVEPQRIGKQGKRAKAGRKDAVKDAVKAIAGPEPAASGDVKESSQSKRELDQDDLPADKKKRQTISLHGGPVELGGDLDASLLSQGLSGLLPQGEFLGGPSAMSPHPTPLTYVDFQQLVSLSPASSPGPSPLPPRPPPAPKKENEPAEGEVMAVMAMCSGCAPDPFAKVNVISWQGTAKKLYSGVLYLPAKPVCRKF